jgi:hypothetical protein
MIIEPWTCPPRPAWGTRTPGDGFRHPVKKPQGGELTTEQRWFNKAMPGIHGVAERANALFEVTLNALCRVSLDLPGITRITRAALVLLQLEHGRTTWPTTTSVTALPGKAHCSSVTAPMTPCK